MMLFFTVNVQTNWDMLVQYCLKDDDNNRLMQQDAFVLCVAQQPNFYDFM